MSESRIQCCIPECRRSFKASVAALEHKHDEVMCGRCYRTAERHLIERHKLIHRRWRRCLRLARFKTIQGKRRYLIQLDRLEISFVRACARSWAEIKADVVMKSAMRLEGTAGHLAAKRRP